MMLRIGERQRLGRFGDQADKALALAHRGEMDGLAVQAFGREKFEPAVGAQNVNRANLGHHIRGDENDDLIEPVLRADRLGHDFAQPPQQLTRPSRHGAHHLVLVRPFGLGFIGRHKLIRRGTESDRSGKTPAARSSNDGAAAIRRVRKEPRHS